MNCQPTVGHTATNNHLRSKSHLFGEFRVLNTSSMFWECGAGSRSNRRKHKQTSGELASSTKEVKESKLQHQNGEADVQTQRLTYFE